MPTAFEDSSANILRVLADSEPRLRAKGEEWSARPWGADKWTPREVMGHLVDSALNNYQRVVRAQQGDALEFPGYEQEHWVRSGGYARRTFADLIDLWLALNRQLAHALAAVPASREGTQWRVGDGGAPVTLAWVARDYVKHLEHHLVQILDPDRAQGRAYQPLSDSPAD